MNRRVKELFAGLSGSVLLLSWAAMVAQAQVSKQVEVKRGEVVYVSGNDLVVKNEQGQVKHFTVPDDMNFTIDGKDLSIHELKPGMKLTQTITTTTEEKTVTSVRTIKGKVWQVMPPQSVILTLPDGTNKQYKVPKGTKFAFEGGDAKSVFDLKPGMNVTATVVTSTPETLVSRQSSVSGQAPPPPPKSVASTPPVVGVILLEEVVVAPRTEMAKASAPPAPAPQAPAAPAPASLPKTASPVPLIGILGLAFASTGLALRLIKK